MSKLKREEIIKYIIKIQINFDNSYSTSSDLERELLVESWYEALCSYPAEVCSKAVNNVLKRAKFAPRLGDITEEIERLLSPDKKTDDQLWAELTEVLPSVYDISRYLAYSQHYKRASAKLNEIYSALDGELKLFVVNVSVLIDISEMSDDDLKFERARFFRQMPLLRKHSKDKKDAQKFLQDVMKQAQLTDGSKKKKDDN